jgi:hypothetical protein
MIEYYSLYFCIFFFVLVFLIYYLDDGLKCLIDDSLYPELVLFQKYSDIVDKELIKSIKTDRWVDMAIFDTSIRPFIDPTNVQTSIDIIRNNYEPLETRAYTAKYFFLIFYGYNLLENTTICPNLLAMINGIPRITTAYIRCVKPGTVTNPELYPYENTYLCYVPLSNIEPKYGIVLNDELYEYANLLNYRRFIIMNSYCKYQLWNYTASNKFILVIAVRQP